MLAASCTLDTGTGPEVCQFSLGVLQSNNEVAPVNAIDRADSNKEELVDLISINREKKNVLVLMKIGKRWEWVKNLLKKEDIICKSVIALNVGMPDQIVQEVSKFNLNKVPYFSLLLILSLIHI